MDILISNNHLNTFGGSESYTYTLIEEMLFLKHNVEYFTFHKGTVSELIEKNLGVKFMTKDSYDIVLTNHNNCVEYLRVLLHEKTKIIQTCHGIFPELEQPSIYADGHISISNEVKNHLLKLNINSNIIYNGINCERFNIQKPINDKLKTILSLCQSDKANKTLDNICSKLGVELIYLNKHSNPEWNVEDKINKADLVIGLGRSAYEAMACGRPVIIYDNRSYFRQCGDGYIKNENIDYSLNNNCSGRASKKVFSEIDLINEIKKYNPKDGASMREIALNKFNIKKQAASYLKHSELILKKDIDTSSLFSHILEKILNKNLNYLPFLTLNKFINTLSPYAKKELLKTVNNTFEKAKDNHNLEKHIDWQKKQNKELTNGIEWLKKQNKNLNNDIDCHKKLNNELNNTIKWYEKQNKELIDGIEWLKKQNNKLLLKKNNKLISLFKKKRS